MSVSIAIQGPVSGLSFGKRVTYKAVAEPANFDGVFKWYVANNDGSNVVVSPDTRTVTVTWIGFTSRDPSTGKPVGELSLYAYPRDAGFGTDCLAHAIERVVPTVLVDLTIVDDEADASGGPTDDDETAGVGLTHSDVDPESWIAVKGEDRDIIVEATTDPNDEETWKRIKWAGGAPVKGKPNQRRVSRKKAGKFPIVASLGGTIRKINVWILWCDLVIQISGTIDKGNNARFLAPGPAWPNGLAGGTKLGPWSAKDEAMGNATYDDEGYKFAFGKMQAKATLQPAGVETVIRRALFGYSGKFEIKRIMSSRMYEDGGLEQRDDDADDTSSDEFTDLDPTSGISERELYDLDAPACPGITVQDVDVRRRTSEVYENFTQYVTVFLGYEILKCSDEKTWSYQAQIDFDKSKNKVERNQLSLKHIELSDEPRYEPRTTPRP